MRFCNLIETFPCFLTPMHVRCRNITFLTARDVFRKNKCYYSIMTEMIMLLFNQIIKNLWTSMLSCSQAITGNVNIKCYRPDRWWHQMVTSRLSSCRMVMCMLLVERCKKKKYVTIYIFTSISDNIMLLYGRTAKFILTICVIVWLNESIDVLI